MSERRICKYCGMELSEDVPHGLRQCHLHAVARIAELEALVERLIEAGDRLSDSLCTYPEEDKTIEVCNWNAIVAEYKEREE